jgi:YHS domain-containing protein
MTRSEPIEIENPVTACGGKIKDPSIYPTADYKGKVVYFCTDACLQAFHTDPDGFMAGEVEHPE